MFTLISSFSHGARLGNVSAPILNSELAHRAKTRRCNKIQHMKFFVSIFTNFSCFLCGCTAYPESAEKLGVAAGKTAENDCDLEPQRRRTQRNNALGVAVLRAKVCAVRVCVYLEYDSYIIASWI